jgi:hypothetical protein
MAENPIGKDDIIKGDEVKQTLQEIINLLEKGLIGAMQGVSKEAASLADNFSKVNVNTAEGRAIVSEAATATAKLTNEQKQLIQISQALEKEKTKMSLLEKEGVQNKIRETSELKKSNQEKQKEVTQGKAAADSYAAMTKRLKELREAWGNASGEVRKGLTPQVNKLEEELFKLDKTLGRHQRNVGNYGSVLKGLASNILAATGLTAGLAGGIKLVGEVIRSTNAGADRFEFFLGGIREGMGFLARSISNLDFSNLVSGFKNAYIEGKRYAEALADIDDLQGALGLQKQDIEADIIRQRIIAKNRSLDLEQREAALDEIVRLEQLKLTKTQEVNDRALDNALQNAEAVTKVDRDKIVDFVTNADLYVDKIKEIDIVNERLKKQAEETTYAQVGDAMIQTTSMNMNKYRDAVSKLSEEEQYYLELLKLDQALTGDKVSGIRGDVIKALGDQKTAINELAMSEEQLVRLRNSLYNELIKEEKELTTSLNKEADERQKAAISALEASSKAQAKSIRDQGKANSENIIIDAQATSTKLVEIKKQEVQEIQGADQVNAEFKKEMNREVIRDAIASAEESFQIVSEASQVLGDILNAQKQRELNAAGDNAEKREAIEREYFKKEQALAVAQAVINGALAITKVTAQTGILSPLAIPLIVATTLGQIALISAQKFAEGGYTGDGAYRDETGERVAGIVHEKEFVLDKESTKKYRPLIEAIHEDDPAKIAAIVSNEHMHNIWGNMNKAMAFEQDPYTRMMYEIMRGQPSVYVDTDGNTVLQYMGRKQVIRKN